MILIRFIVSVLVYTAMMPSIIISEVQFFYFARKHGAKIRQEILKEYGTDVKIEEFSKVFLGRINEMMITKNQVYAFSAIIWIVIVLFILIRKAGIHL